ncbi:SMC family ATPase [Streptomyces termitum]|uniref:SMC family ATPase n=1 Tax=Streptomyces termitum TaxID=67368 RepID=UPI0033B31927
MRLHRLEITAFGPFGTTQTIDFDTLSTAGLFLLHGPTGAGKTSVLDAVCFALYGSVPGARQAPGTTLRSDHAPAGTLTSVLLDLTVAGRRLEIVRIPAQPRPKKRGGGFTMEKARSTLRAYDPATRAWTGLSKSHQEIGEEITQLLGMSRDQFCQVVLLPQGDFARFLRADAEARGKLLGRLFDTRRFAAVEERLADLRRVAAHRVEEGDTRLLGLAHRMAQAAAGLPVARTPVDGKPGEPGLADTVLGWGAIARTEAREAADIAAVRLATAEHAEAATRTAAGHARDLAARQARHAEALHRRALLDARAPERDAARHALDLALRADRVAPALALRRETEREHAAALAARRAARSLLPPDLAEAPAEQLSAFEHRLREELGALGAARRAEHRAAALAEERTALDREARADEEALQEAAAWLADWEPRRAALQQRVETARDAAARAEQLAGRLEPLRLRLAAARRRDALAQDLARAEEHHATAREERNTAHETWLDLKSRRLRGIAAELAATLTDGDPCQVCGSTTHPAPTPPGADHVDRATEEAAYASYTRADETSRAAERALAGIREALAAAREEVHSLAAPGQTHRQPTVAELAAEAGELTRRHTEAHALAARTHEARETLARAEREAEERATARREAERRVAARTSQREALDTRQAEFAEEAARGRGTFATVAEHADRLERRIALLVGAVGAVRDEEVAADRLKRADAQLADAAYQAGFTTPAEASAALLDPYARRERQHRLDAWQAEAAAVADRLAEPGVAEAAALPPADLPAAEAAHTAAERALRAAGAELAAARERVTGLAGLARQAEAEVRRLGPLHTEHDRVARLAGLTAGTSTENERRMRLESYVLAARLEQVAAAASARLQRMSSGRYTLVHSDARAGARRSGLGLHVVDAWTGNERDTATLSGGETFFASLALALGLADVVTDEAGGVRLDTLFIDEGFGSLDDQTLDEVLDVLDSLRERDRSVGIVSHVADLRRRIPAQLEVTKSRHGSAVRLRTGADALGG